MPAVATRIMVLAQDPRTTVEALAGVVSTDQSLTARLIRLSNSAEYAFGRRCANAKDAIQLLGFLQVRQIAVTTSLMGMFEGPRPDDLTFDSDLFWAHSLTVGVAAEAAARLEGKVRPDDAFTAGILHDIGQLVLRRALPVEFRAAGTLALETGMPLHEAELQTTGYTHQAVGKALARRWQFPTHLARAIGSHHDEGLTPAANGLAGIIAQCDRLVLHQGITCGYYGERDEATPLPPDLQDLEERIGGMTAVMNRATWFMEKTFGRSPRATVRAC